MAEAPETFDLDGAVAALRARFGAEVKRRRLAANMLQRELAERCGLKHQSVVSKFEQGTATVTDTTLVRFSAALGTTPGAMLGEPDA